MQLRKEALLMKSKIMTWFGQNFGLHPDKPIYKHWLFWLAILIPAVFSLWLSIPIIPGLEYFCRGTECYTNFSRMFKFPLWILSGSVVLGVIVARFHFSLQRSKAIEQTERNLELTSANNNFKIYCEHKDYFKNYIKASSLIIKERDEITGIHRKCAYLNFDQDKIYKFFFSANSMSEVETRLTKVEFKRIFNEINYLPYRYEFKDGDVYFYPFHIPITIKASKSFFNNLGLVDISHEGGSSNSPTSVKHLMLCVTLELAKSVFNVFSAKDMKNLNEEFYETITPWIELELPAAFKASAIKTQQDMIATRFKLEIEEPIN